MQVRVNLMGGLKVHSPGGGVLELPDQATVHSALEALGLDTAALQVVMINGKPQPDRGHELKADDELTMIPPVSGG